MAVLCYLSVISCRQIVCILYCNMPDDQGKGGNFKGNCSAALGGGGGGERQLKIIWFFQLSSDCKLATVKSI